MDQAIALNFKKKLSESNNILIVLPEFSNTDTVSAASVLYSFITTTLKKKAFIGNSKNIPERFSHILENGGISDENIISEILPLKYVVKVNNTENDLEISVDRKGNDVDIIMIPKKSEIDLGNVTLTTVGHKFDYFVFINVSDLDEAGDIYLKNKDLYKKSNSLVISSNERSSGNYEIISAKENTTACETVYQLLNLFGANLNHAMKETLFEGIVLGTDGLHRLNSFKAFEVIEKISSVNELQSRMSDLFYNFSPEGLELRKRIFQNLNYTGEYVYSELSEKDLNELGIKGSQLDGIDYLPFGIVEGINTYIMSYNYDGKKRVLVETDNKDEFVNKLKNTYKLSNSKNIISFETDDSKELIISNLFNTSAPRQNDTPVKPELSDQNQSGMIYTNDTNQPPFTTANGAPVNPNGNPFEPLKK